jgi:predicted PurR-regulated permease PerM
MPLLKVTPSQRTILAVATVISILIGAWFLKRYIMLVLFSALAVILFNPIYHWFLKKGRSPQKAAFYTMMISALSVIIPLVLVSIITFFQVQHLVNIISSGSYSHNVTQLATDIINKINEILANTGISYRLTLDGIAQALSSAAQNFGKAFVGGLLSSVSGFFGFITAAIIYIYVFLSMIIHQDKILDTLKKLNPLGDTASNLYFERIGAMTKATVRGQFIIALCQGTESAAILALVGLSNLFFFFWMLLTVMSIIPLGAGIITIPIGIIMILTGNVWQGVLVIANHLVIVTNIDNVLRPRLVPRHARLDPALMILAVFAGLGMFGFFGIVLGPVLMIILLTTIQMYLEVFTETKSIDRSTDATTPGLFRRMQFWRRAEG